MTLFDYDLVGRTGLDPASFGGGDRPPERNHCGIVYFIRDPLTGLLKIGKTRSLARRLCELEYGAGTKLIVEHYVFCEDPDLVERVLHAYYEGVRVVGEWFNIDEIAPWLSKETCIPSRDWRPSDSIELGRRAAEAMRRKNQEGDAAIVLGFVRIPSLREAIRSAVSPGDLLSDDVGAVYALALALADEMPDAPLDGAIGGNYARLQSWAPGLTDADLTEFVPRQVEYMERCKRARRRAAQIRSALSGAQAGTGDAERER